MIGLIIITWETFYSFMEAGEGSEEKQLEQGLEPLGAFNFLTYLVFMKGCLFGDNLLAIHL